MSVVDAPVVHAIIGLTAWASLIGLSGAWERYCQRHPEVVERLAPPETFGIGDQAEDWLRSQDRPPNRSD